MDTQPPFPSLDTLSDPDADQARSPCTDLVATREASGHATATDLCGKPSYTDKCAEVAMAGDGAVSVGQAIAVGPSVMAPIIQQWRPDIARIH